MRGTDEIPTKNIQSYQEMQNTKMGLPKVGIDIFANVPVTKKLGKLNITEDQQEENMRKAVKRI